MLKGCGFFIALVAISAGASGILLLIGRDPGQGWPPLLFAAVLVSVLVVARVIRATSERRRIATPSGHIRLTDAGLTVPSLAGGLETIRWVDLEEVRLTRDTAANIDYEFYTGDENPAILLSRSRVLDPGTFDRELGARSRLVRTFEEERSGPLPPSMAVNEIPAGDRFDLSLPWTTGQSLRGCAGLVVVLGGMFGLAIAFPDTALRWFNHDASLIVLIIVLLLAIFLATRSRRAWMIAAPDGLYVRAGKSAFPSVIRWNDLRDYTFVRHGGKNPSTTVTMWTPEGSWQLKRIRIKDEARLKEILEQRSARKPQSFRDGFGLS